MESRSQFQLNFVLLAGKEVLLTEVALVGKFELLLTQLPAGLFDKKTIGSSIHYRSKEAGLEMEFEKERLNSLFLYLHEKGISGYAGKLPCGLTYQATMEEVLSRLGEPSTKHGGKSTFVQLTYDRLGLQFSIKTTNWEQREAKIMYIVLFEPNKSKPAYCSVCKKTTVPLSCNCSFVLYCSEQCQQLFEKQHKKYCV